MRYPTATPGPNTIAATTTRTGPTVIAELDTGDYPKGIKISDREIQNLEKQNVLRRHDFHGEWNLCVSGHKFHYARPGIMSSPREDLVLEAGLELVWAA